VQSAAVSFQHFLLDCASMNGTRDAVTNFSEFEFYSDADSRMFNSLANKLSRGSLGFLIRVNPVEVYINKFFKNSL